MKKIKILVDAHVIDGEGQGSVTYLTGLYNTMMVAYSDYYEIYIAGYDFTKMAASFPTLEKRYFIQLVSHSRIKRLTIDFPSIIKKYGIDLAHFQYITPFFKNTKFAVTTHDVLFNDFPTSFSWSYRMLRNVLFRRSLQKSEIKCTVSTYSQVAIARYYQLEKRALTITLNAVEASFFELYEKKMEQQFVQKKFGVKNYLLFVSRIEPRKNHHLLLKAFKELQLAEQGYTLVFVGNESIPNFQLNEELKSLSIAERGNFKWIRYVDKADLLALYRAANLFVYPSLAEGFGIPPIEAAAAGIPTICANNTAMRDFDFFGNNLVDINDFEKFKRRIKENLDDPLADFHLKQIVQEVAKRYTWEKSAWAFHKAIQDQFNPHQIAEDFAKAA